MVRFSTTLCPSEEPPPAKRLKTSSLQQQEQEVAEEPDAVHKSRALSASSTSSTAPPRPNTCIINDPIAAFDLDILDCIVCLEALSPPIFQCCNGHYACRDCTRKIIRKMSSKCPSCPQSIGTIRNLGLEKILESLRVRCKFHNQGCLAGMLPYGVKKSHEQRCLFAPRDCPLTDCSFNGPLDGFSSHFNHNHNVKTIPFCFDTRFTVALSLTDNYVLLKGGNTYFLLQAHEEYCGKLLYVSFVVPPDYEEIYTYQMEVKTGKRHLTLSSTVQGLRHSKSNLNLIEFLLAPRCFLGNEGYQVEVFIKRGTEGAIET